MRCDYLVENVLITSFTDETLIILKNIKTQGCKPNVVSYDGVIMALTNKVLEEEGKGKEKKLKIWKIKSRRQL